MSAFWSSYANFVHNLHAPVRDEFARLATQRQWREGSRHWRTEWSRCCAEEFADQFGTQGTLQGWRDLCAEVGIAEVPPSISACKKILKRTWINLVDLIDARRTRTKVKQHASQKALRRYSVRSKKIFPKEAAKSNRFLSVLLIEMFSSPVD